MSHFRAYLMRYSGSPQSTALGGIGSTNTQVRYDWWENGDPSVFEPRAFTGSSNPVVLSTDLVGSVRLKQPGHYTITMAMVLFDSTYGHKQEWNDSDDEFGFAETAMGGGDRSPAHLTSPPGDLYNAVGWLTQTITVIYPLPAYGGDPPDTYWPETLGDGGFVTGFVTVGSLNQTGSNDNELEYAKLEILYTPLTVVPPIELDPDAQPAAPDPPAQGIAFAPDSDTLASPVWSGRLDVV